MKAYLKKKNTKNTVQVFGNYYGRDALEEKEKCLLW